MVQGIWNVVLETPAGDRRGVLELKTDGEKLTGVISDGEHLVPIADGRVDGDVLRWSAKISKPMSLTLKFTATVEGDRISGVAKHLLGKATFKGTRA